MNKYVVEEPPSDIHERFNVATMEPTRNKLDEVDIKKKKFNALKEKLKLNEEIVLQKKDKYDII